MIIITLYQDYRSARHDMLSSWCTYYAQAKGISAPQNLLRGER